MLFLQPQSHIEHINLAIKKPANAGFLGFISPLKASGIF